MLSLWDLSGSGNSFPNLENGFPNLGNSFPNQPKTKKPSEQLGGLFFRRLPDQIYLSRFLICPQVVDSTSTVREVVSITLQKEA